MTIANRLRIHCVCGRVALIAVQGLNRLGYERVLGLKPLLKRDSCGQKGRADLTIVWADR